MSETENKKLVTIVVQRKDGQKAVDAVLAAGASGVTFYYGRGTGVRQKLGLLGRFIEAEKQVILAVVPSDCCGKVMAALEKSVDLGRPGRGFAYVQAVEHVLGFYGEEHE